MTQTDLTVPPFDPDLAPDEPLDRPPQPDPAEPDPPVEPEDE